MDKKRLKVTVKYQCVDRFIEYCKNKKLDFKQYPCKGHLNFLENRFGVTACIDDFDGCKDMIIRIAPMPTLTSS